MDHNAQKPELAGSKTFQFREINAPILPVEIWTKVFAFATHIPGSFEVNDYAAIAAFTRDRHGICLSNRYKATMQTKLSFSLVCRYWNGIVQQFLFEYLRIRTGEEACAIADMLERMGRQTGFQEDPGRWTIRIDLALEGVHSWLPKHARAMFRILKHCPNLLCFSSAFSTDDPWTYGLPTMLRHFAQNPRLTRLEIKVDHEVIPIIEEAFGNCLEVLWLVPCRRFLALDDWKKSFVLPNIRALIATAGCERYINRTELPNLRACVLDRTSIGLFPLIDRRLVEYCSVSDVREIFTDLNNWPSLVTLSVSVGDLATLKIPWQEHLQHEHLECIMIEDIDCMRRKMLMTKLDTCKQLFSQLDENLTHFLSPYSFPYLSCVRIFLSVQGRRNTSPLLSDEEESIWHTWLKVCSDRGIRIEVSGGAMEWTGDQWTEYPHEEVFDMLFMPISIVEEDLKDN